MIRKAREEDIDALDNIYSQARRFMIENNNPEQWGNDHPSKEFILEKIRDGVQFVSENDKEIDGTFSFIIGEDETYQLIDDGEFIDSSLYGTIHSLAKKKGQIRSLFGGRMNMTYRSAIRSDPNLRSFQIRLPYKALV